MTKWLNKKTSNRLPDFPANRIRRVALGTIPFPPIASLKLSIVFLFLFFRLVEFIFQFEFFLYWALVGPLTCSGDGGGGGGRVDNLQFDFTSAFSLI